MDRNGWHARSFLKYAGPFGEGRANLVWSRALVFDGAHFPSQGRHMTLLGVPWGSLLPSRSPNPLNKRLVVSKSLCKRALNYERGHIAYHQDAPDAQTHPSRSRIGQTPGGSADLVSWAPLGIYCRPGSRGHFQGSRRCLCLHSFVVHLACHVQRLDRWSRGCRIA